MVEKPTSIFAKNRKKCQGGGGGGEKLLWCVWARFLPRCQTNFGLKRRLAWEFLLCDSPLSRYPNPDSVGFWGGGGRFLQKMQNAGSVTGSHLIRARKVHWRWNFVAPIRISRDIRGSNFVWYGFEWLRAVIGGGYFCQLIANWQFFYACHPCFVQRSHWRWYFGSLTCRSRITMGQTWLRAIFWTFFPIFEDTLFLPFWVQPLLLTVLPTNCGPKNRLALTVLLDDTSLLTYRRPNMGPDKFFCKMNKSQRNALCGIASYTIVS